MPGQIEILIEDVNDVQARVVARYNASPDQIERNAHERVVVSGFVRGPYCETARTLPAEIAFRELAAAEIPQSEVVVPDPCVWSPELPHVYQADVEARRGDRILAEYHGRFGLRRMSPRRVGIEFPG
jgi:beta-galactosidase/beta-glucuronidase